MNNLVELDTMRRRASLEDWVLKCTAEMGKEHRYPAIDFNSNTWAIQSIYKTKLADVSLTATVGAFADLDISYVNAVRCMAAERTLEGNVVTLAPELTAWRLLARSGPASVTGLRRPHLNELEMTLVDECRTNPSSAGTTAVRLKYIESFVERLSRVGVIEPISWRATSETRKTLSNLRSQNRSKFREQKASTLDRQVEALSDATSAMFKGDERLSASDRAALAIMGIMMCAPSRINEPLCMSINDIFSIEDYTKRPDGQERTDQLGRAHMLLMQKGSKGADWGAKPVLNFMIDMLHLCIKTLKEGGKRSRMLAAWYEQNPQKLYLPPALEFLRGQMIDRSALWQILNLAENPPSSEKVSSVNRVWKEVMLEGQHYTIRNSRSLCSDGDKNSRATIQGARWEDVESILLRRVDKSLDNVRRVTEFNHYEGRVSNMLMLIDAEQTPYLPASMNYKTLRSRLNQTEANRKKAPINSGSQTRSLFEKLDLTLVVDGKIQYAGIRSHDPRSWLTTQAMQARERLSDVLINKWANRLSINQLKHYDLRSDTQRADQAAMPDVEALEDISSGLEQLKGIEAEYGLRTEIVVAHEAGVSVTSMEAVASAVDDRPVAKTSGQLIILYPSRFGVCLHQHHETPCRSYTSCMACSENLVVKGHLPTNEDVRKRHDLLTRSIVNQLERLVTAHNRQIADSPDGLESHMLALVSRGLTPEQMADELIAEFHEIKDRIKSQFLRTRLEEAFVARGMVQRLDDTAVASGALMRYHNPARHAAPGHERALDAHGGRAAINARLETFQEKHPEFAPTRVGLKDERELLEDDENEDGD